MKLKREGTPKQDMNMKKLFRRNQIIITTLAIMIAAAGYLNYAGKRELEASAGDGIYQAGTFDISEEDLLAENQKNGAGDTALIEEAAMLDHILIYINRSFANIVVKIFQ